MTGNKPQLSSGDVQPSGMACPACSNRFYYSFSKFWLWSSTFFALLGLSKIGHLQMNFQYALQIYVFLCICGIILPGIRLSAKPGSLERSGVSILHRFNFIFYLFLCGFAIVIATNIYSSIIPVKSSLIEIKGRIKEIGIRSGKFSFITLNTPRNIEFIVNDRFDSPAAHLQPGADVSLFVDKDPSITGDSYTVWEVRDREGKTLLPYEDLRITRSYEAINGQVPFLAFLGVSLLGYVCTRYLLNRRDLTENRNPKSEKPHRPESIIEPPCSVGCMETTELELGDEFHNNPISIASIIKNTNFSIQNILALIATISVITAVVSIFIFMSITAFKVSAVIFITSVIVMVMIPAARFMVYVYHANKILFTALLLLITGAISIYIFGSPYRLYENITAPPAITKTANTIYTAHLEGPITSESNVLYCASFQKAWDMMHKQVIKEEVRLEDDPLIARQLNRQSLGNDDISLDSYVAGAGAYSQELVERVNRELGQKFGSQVDEKFSVPQASAGDRSIIAYAFLYKNLEFPTEFEKLPTPLSFQANGSATPVKVFGIELFSHSKRLHEKLVNQVAVLDYHDDSDFILSLTSKSKDDEIIMAKIKPGKTLLDTYQAVTKRIAGGTRSDIRENESMQIPKIDFDLSHNFPELVGRRLLNRGWEEWHIAAAVQDIRFKLDEKGAVLKSRAFMLKTKEEAPAPGDTKPRMFIFDKPFLICMKQKTGNSPYFALWVNNPELMRKK